MKKILIIAGPSGVGKTTVAQRIIDKFGRYCETRSMTTRSPRGDAHDSEYIYVTRAEFSEHYKNGALLEMMEYNGNFYGTPHSEIVRIFGEGKTPLLVLDLEGVKSFRNRAFDFSPIIFYIWDELNVIEKRLYTRDLSEPTAEKLSSFIDRVTHNRADYKEMPEIAHLFNAFVKNESIDDCAEEIVSLFEAFSVSDTVDVQSNLQIAQSLKKMAEEKE